jgi:OmpA-OmpF porin, OOP family
MASKKYSILLGLFGLMTFSAANAQTGAGSIYRGNGYDVTDTTLIPARRMDQQRDFLNKNYDFPAKPRSQWEVGVGFGPLNISGDVRSKSFLGFVGNRALTPGATLGWHVSVRKALGYMMSLRLQYLHGAASGYNWQASQSHVLQGRNPYWAAYGSGIVYDAYKTNVRELSLQLVGALNNIKFHRARNKVSAYGLFGVGGLFYYTRNNVYNDGSGTANARYDFKKLDSAYTSLTNVSVNQPTWTSGYKNARKYYETELKAMFDDTYETDAERHDNRYYAFGDKYTFRPVATAGIGLQWRVPGLSRLVIGLEDKVTFTMDDLLDGHRWQEPGQSTVPVDQPTNGLGWLNKSALTRDFDNINYVGLSLGINIGNKAVAPLWWVNPMDYAYHDLMNKSTPIMPKDCSIDTDGDGVSDCFDKCNDTPLGVAVDVKGCCLDTDGDGVCDYKDLELITPTKCQPVDANGVGNCPCPDACGDRKGGEPEIKCGGINSGVVNFTAGNTKLSGGAMSQLNNLASNMRANPSCKVILAGNGTSKVEQQRSWVRTNAVLNYMVSQGIERDRFCFEYGNSGAANTVEYRTAPDGADCGGTPPPPPHPNLK